MAVKQLVEKRTELQTKQKTLHDVMTESKGPAGSNGDMDMNLVTSLKGTNKEKVQEYRKMIEEVDALGEEVDALAYIEQAAINLAKAHDVKGGDDAPKGRFSGNDGDDAFEQKHKHVKGLGDMLVESDLYKQRLAGTAKYGIVTIAKGLRGAMTKTLFQTSAGWDPESIRTGRVVEEQLRPIQVLDTVPGGQTGEAVIVYMEETTVTDLAAARNEGAIYAESTLALTQKTVNVQSIGTSLPVTDEQLADEAQVASYINMRLTMLVRRKLDTYVLTGSGVSPIPLGFNNLVTIQTQAKGADPVPDAFYKAMTLVRVTGRSTPNIVYIHPNDWQDIRLLRTTDGVYIWGNPSEAGPLRLWGVTVLETDSQTENTGLVGDVANHTQLFMRQDLTLEIGLDSDDFTKGIQTVRVGLRAAIVGYRPQAFCEVTGI